MTDERFEDLLHSPEQGTGQTAPPDDERPTTPFAPSPGHVQGGWPAGWGFPPPPPGPPAKSERRRRGWVAVLVLVLAGLLLFGGGIGIGWDLGRAGNDNPTTTSGAPIGPGRSGRGLDAQAIANRVDPALVDINTFVGGARSPLGRGPLQAFGAGTGMVLSPSGEVLTNNHVVEGATLIRVTVGGRSNTHTARVVGVDPSADVALLQIEGVSGLPTVTLADSSGLNVGQAVVALGNALGRGGTPSLTQGTITGLNRSITAGEQGGATEHLTGVIQTDAPISPGDSGGALVNSDGQVVGMITAAGRSFSSFGTTSGFAIPVTSALHVVNEIRAGHESSDIIIGRAGFLGVEARNLSSAAATRLGLGVTSGALIVNVVPGTPAAGAGISKNSVITAVNGESVASADTLGPALHSHKPGEQVRVTWVDASGTHDATVTLIGGPAV